MTIKVSEAKTPLANVSSGKDIQLDADNAEERVRVQPRASFQPPEHCPDCAAGVPFGADGHHVNQVSERTRLIREQQRGEIGKAVTAIMVSRSAEHDQLTAYREALETISHKKYDTWAFSECRSIARNVLADYPITQPTASPKERNPTTVPDHSQASPPESESSISSTLAEIRERLVHKDTWRQPAWSDDDVRGLVSIVDDLRNQQWTAERVIAWMDNPKRQPAMHAFTAGNERQIAYRYERALSDIGSLQAELQRSIEYAERLNGDIAFLSSDVDRLEAAASNMKAEILKRVREFDDWVWCECSECKVDARAHAVNAGASLSKLATELEAIEVKDDPGR